jgi:hypothetical protein
VGAAVGVGERIFEMVVLVLALMMGEGGRGRWCLMVEGTVFMVWKRAIGS